MVIISKRDMSMDELNKQHLNQQHSAWATAWKNVRKNIYTTQSLRI